MQRKSIIIHKDVDLLNRQLQSCVKTSATFQGHNRINVCINNKFDSISLICIKDIKLRHPYQTYYALFVSLYDDKDYTTY